ADRRVIETRDGRDDPRRHGHAEGRRVGAARGTNRGAPRWLRRHRRDGDHQLRGAPRLRPSLDWVLPDGGARSPARRAVPGNARVRRDPVRQGRGRHGRRRAADSDRPGRLPVRQPHHLRLARPERDRRARLRCGGSGARRLRRRLGGARHVRLGRRPGPRTPPPLVPPMKLYAFWRSTASWRVRVALAYKGVPFDVLPVFLTGGEQYDKGYGALNPMAQVPLLVMDDGRAISHALAI